MPTEYHYYIAAGKSLEIIEQFRRDRIAAIELRKAFCAEFGGKGWGTVESLMGVAIGSDAEIPLGWRHSKNIKDGQQVIVPDKRKKIGREIDAKMRSLVAPGSSALSSRIGYGLRLGGPNPHGSGVIILYPTLEEIGGKYVIGIPIGGRKNGEETEFVPPDAAPIKTSEYWAMKEAESAAI